MADIASARQWAEALGHHALAASAAGLLVVLGGTALAFFLLRRLAMHRDTSPLPPAAFLALRLGIGFGLIVAAAAVFAEMMEATDAGEAMGAFDTRLAEVLAQTLPPALLQPIAWLTHLGDQVTLTAIVVGVASLLAWRGRRWLALGVALVGAGNGLLNQSLKHVFARVRPVHEHGFAVADGFSFPSGHTSGSVVVYGTLAYLGLRLLPPAWHGPGVLAAAALAWSIGVSRILLQVHWASDVLAGFASGLAWLTVCIVSIEMLRRYRRTPGA